MHTDSEAAGGFDKQSHGGSMDALEMILHTVAILYAQNNALMRQFLDFQPSGTYEGHPFAQQQGLYTLAYCSRQAIEPGDEAAHLVGLGHRRSPAPDDYNASLGGGAGNGMGCPAFFRLTTGGALTLELTWGLLMEKDFAYLNLFGSGGAALLNPFRLHKGMHGSLVNVTPTLETSRNQYKQGIEAQISHFADVLRRGTKPMGSAEEILPAMELLDAVYRSADQGKEVKLG